MNIMGKRLPSLRGLFAGFTGTRTLSPLNDSRGWITLHDTPPGAFQKDLYPIDCYSVMRHPTVYACVTQISNDFGKLRQRLAVKGKRDVWTEVVEPSPFQPVLRKPNRYQNQIQFKQWWMTCKLSWGNSYALKERDQRGVVNRLYLMDPARVTPLVAADGSIFYELNGDELNEIAQEGVVVPASEIIHDRMNCLWHPLIGVSPIYAAGLAARIGEVILRNTDVFFFNDSNPGGILMVPGSLDPEKAKKMKKDWDDNWGGPKNKGKLAVLADGMKYQPMRQTAVESQTVEQSEWLDEKICSAFHMPKYKVGVGEYPTFDNIEALAQEYYSGCLQSLIEEYEAVMDEGLGLDTPTNGRQLGVDLDLSPLLRMDRASLITSLAEATGKTLMTFNEARGELGLPDVNGGDSLWMQEQNYQVETLLQRDREDPFEKPEPVAPPVQQQLPLDDPDADDEADAEEARALGEYILKALTEDMVHE